MKTHTQSPIRTTLGHMSFHKITTSYLIEQRIGG